MFMCLHLNAWLVMNLPIPCTIYRLGTRLAFGTEQIQYLLESFFMLPDNSQVRHSIPSPRMENASKYIKQNELK
jgi:hypothetical protein